MKNPNSPCRDGYPRLRAEDERASMECGHPRACEQFESPPGVAKVHWSQQYSCSACAHEARAVEEARRRGEAYMQRKCAKIARDHECGIPYHACGPYIADAIRHGEPREELTTRERAKLWFTRLGNVDDLTVELDAAAQAAREENDSWDRDLALAEYVRGECEEIARVMSAVLVQRGIHALDLQATIASCRGRRHRARRLA